MFPKWIAHVPVEEWRDPHDASYSAFKAAGVTLMLKPPCRIPDCESWRLEDALKAKAAAEGVNMPVALDPGVWLLRCKRCKAPFIDLPHARMCSDACRADAKRDAVRRASAKRAARRAEASQARTSTCRHCGERLPARRSSKRFCSVGCRVAAHRGAPATYVVQWPDTGETPEAAWLAWGAAYRAALDRQIADMRSLGAAAQCGYLDAATLRMVLERSVALQAERAKLR